MNRQPGAFGHARPLRVLYVCYLTLDDPLTHTQVVAYLSGLAEAGHPVHLLTFEPERLTRSRRRRWRVELQRLGIRWHGLRYHKRPSLLATAADTVIGAAWIAALVRRHRLEVVHARTHVPAAMALLARSLAPGRTRMVFDIRGLMVEEYEEAGRWRPGGLASRVTRRVEMAAIKDADRIVILTERARDARFDAERRRTVHVIPCCANIERIQGASDGGERVRRELGLGNSRVMVYVGKFPSWSMPREMASFFASAQREISDLHFLVLTQSETELIDGELSRSGVDPKSYTVTSVPPAHLGSYLAASEFAITFIKPAPSTVGQSPTKLGEYLGAGLPVLYSPGIGDIDRLMSPKVGVGVAEHSARAYRDAIRRMIRLVNDPDTAERCRATAERQLSLRRVGIPRYLALYDALSGDSR